VTTPATTFATGIPSAAQRRDRKEEDAMSTASHASPQEGYKTKCAVNDLLGFSTAVGLLIEGIQRRLREEEIQGALTDEQEERLGDFFVKLQRVAEDMADFAREVAEQVKSP
jgi:hypothetical protein